MWSVPKGKVYLISTLYVYKGTKTSHLYFTRFGKVILLNCILLNIDHLPLRALPTRIHCTLDPALPFLSLVLALSLPLIGRLMQWLIVWEVPLSSLAGLEALVRGHIRSFLWSRLLPCRSRRNTARGQQCTSYRRNTSMEGNVCFGHTFVIVMDTSECTKKTLLNATTCVKCNYTSQAGF